MMEIKNLPEVRVLYKALYALKYDVDGDLLSEIIGSPIFANLFDEVAKEYSARHSDLQYMPEKVIYEKEWNVKGRSELAAIKDYLMEYEYWDQIDEVKKRSVVKTFISPFYADDEFLDDLVSQIDKDWQRK